MIARRTAATTVPECCFSSRGSPCTPARIRCGLRRAPDWKARLPLRRLEPCVLRAERLHADGVEPDDQLGIVVQRLDADDTADAELRMLDSHAGAEVHAGGLILVLIRVDRLRLTGAPAAAVRVRPEFVMREVPLIAGRVRRRDALDERCRYLLDEPRR